MPLGRSEHAPDELLKKYSLNQLSERELAPLEEHLLVCQHCRDRLDEVEFAVCTREAASRIETRRGFAMGDATRGAAGGAWLPRAAWATVLAGGLLAAIWVTTRQSQPVTYAAVQLSVARGTGPPGAVGPAGRLLQLQIDLTELPSSSSYSVEVADAAGRTVWKRAAVVADGKLNVQVDAKPPAGRYWVRLYSTGGAELLREFALKLE